MTESPAQELSIPNWSVNTPESIQLQGLRFVDDESGLYKYQPVVVFVLDSDVNNPLVTSMHLERMFDDPEELAVDCIVWLNKMWGHISHTITIIDLDSGDILTKYHAEDLLRQRVAIRELSEINRTDTSVIH